MVRQKRKQKGREREGEGERDVSIYVSKKLKAGNTRREVKNCLLNR